MKLKVLAIYDSKVKAFGHPFYSRSTGEGMREFENIFTSTDQRARDSNFQKFPADFHLYEIAEFDDESGEMIPIKHLSLANGASFISVVRDYSYQQGSSVSVGVVNGQA